MEWIEKNGYIIWALICLGALVFGWLHFRRNPDAKGAKLFVRLVPGADPTGKTPTGLTPRAIVLWLMGVVIVMVSWLFLD